MTLPISEDPKQNTSPPDPQDQSIHEEKWDIDLEEATDYDYPSQFKIILHNDHYTAMDFVIEILITFFHKTRAESEALMLQVHEQGHAIAGVYPREIAESKIRDIKKLAKKKEYPLELSMERN